MESLPRFIGRNDGAVAHRFLIPPDPDRATPCCTPPGDAVTSRARIHESGMRPGFYFGAKTIAEPVAKKRDEIQSSRFFLRAKRG